MNIQVDGDNYFEIAEALHCWLTLNHEGQSSRHYELLCMSQFNPGPLWSETKVTEENEYYSEITENNFEQLFDDLNEYLENKD